MFSGPFGGEVVAGAPGGGSVVRGWEAWGSRLLEVSCGLWILCGLVLPCKPDGGRQLALYPLVTAAKEEVCA